MKFYFYTEGTHTHTVGICDLCAGTVESRTWRRLEIPKSPERWKWQEWTTCEQNGTAWSTVQTLFKPKVQVRLHHIMDGSSLARAIHVSTGPLLVSKRQIEQPIVCYNGFQHTCSVPCGLVSLTAGQLVLEEPEMVFSLNLLCSSQTVCHGRKKISKYRLLKFSNFEFPHQSHHFNPGGREILRNTETRKQVFDQLQWAVVSSRLSLIKHLGQRTPNCFSIVSRCFKYVLTCFKQFHGVFEHIIYITHITMTICFSNMAPKLLWNVQKFISYEFQDCSFLVETHNMARSHQTFDSSKPFRGLILPLRPPVLWKPCWHQRTRAATSLEPRSELLLGAWERLGEVLELERCWVTCNWSKFDDIRMDHIHMVFIHI